MAWFFFHLHECGVVTADREGRELPDQAAAQCYAETAAREIMCSDLSEGVLCLGGHIEIENRDDGGRSTIRFRDAVRIID